MRTRRSSILHDAYEQLSRRRDVKRQKLRGERCAYCGCVTKTGTDHVVPLVRNKRPTGILSTGSEVVRCCAACNSAKGGRSYVEFVMRSARMRQALPNAQDRQRLVRRLSRLDPHRARYAVDDKLVEAYVQLVEDVCDDLQRAADAICVRHHGAERAYCVLEQSDAPSAISAERMAPFSWDDPREGQPITTI